MAKRKSPKRTTKTVPTPESTESETIDATVVDASEAPVDTPKIDAEALETKGYDKFVSEDAADTTTEVDVVKDTTADAETTADVPADTADVPADIEAEVVETSESEYESPDPENVYVPEVVPVVPEPERASVLPLIFAGIITAILGFLAGRSDLLPESLRASAPEAGPAIAAGLADVTDRLAALEATVAALPEPETPVAAVEVDLGPINTQVSGLLEQIGAISPLTDRVDALTTQFDTLAARPQVDVTVPEEALNAALAELRDTSASQQAEIDSQQAEINKLLADARAIRDQTEADANATLQRAALARIMTAVDTGAPFATELDDLQQAGATDVPDALATAAEDGVTPLATLQASYPDAARSALATARSNSEDTGGIGGFLTRQLGTRSIEPREGSDPDAVLSRMEAAVRSGELEDALAEAEMLPEPARNSMATWLEQAQSRQEAVTAANTLADRLSAL